MGWNDVGNQREAGGGGIGSGDREPNFRRAREGLEGHKV